MLAAHVQGQERRLAGSIAVDLKVELDLLIARNVSLYKGDAGGKHWFEAGA